MPFELVANYLRLPVFALVAARVAGLLMFQPVLGAASVPTGLRVLLVFGLAALLTPVVPLPAAAPDTPLGLVLGIGAELLIGAVIGLLSVACFSGLQLAGLMIAQQSGLAFGQIVDPSTEEEESVLGVFYLQLALMVYLSIGGHRALVSACLDTFQTIPLLGDSARLQLGAELLSQALTLSVHVAFRIAGPALLALFLVDLALGFISRTMPQLNILAVGFSIKGLIAFALMAVSLPMAMDAFVNTVERLHGWVVQLAGGG